MKNPGSDQLYVEFKKLLIENSDLIYSYKEEYDARDKVAVFNFSFPVSTKTQYLELLNNSVYDIKFDAIFRAVDKFNNKLKQEG